MTYISSTFIRENFPKGKLALIGGTPSVGKTAFAISLAFSMAEQNKTVIFFSLEMTREQLLNRLKMLLKEDEFSDIEDRLYLNDTPNISPDYIRETLNGKTADYIIIDYVQLMKVDREKKSRTEEIVSIVNNLKDLANELDVSIIGLSQMPRTGRKLRELEDENLEGINVTVLSRDTFGLSAPDEMTKMTYDFEIAGKTKIKHFHFDTESLAVTEPATDMDFLSFDDLVTLYAIDRSGIDDTDLNASVLFEAKKKPVKHYFPCLDEILHDTYGLFVFQEQLVKIAKQIGGLSEVDSDKLRRNICKKKYEDIAVFKFPFIQNAITKGYTEKQADELYQWLVNNSTHLIKREFCKNQIKNWLIHLNDSL